MFRCWWRNFNRAILNEFLTKLCLLKFQTNDPDSFTTLLQVLEGDDVRERRAVTEQDGKTFFLCVLVRFLASYINETKRRTLLEGL